MFLCYLLDPAGKYLVIYWAVVLIILLLTFFFQILRICIGLPVGRSVSHDFRRGVDYCVVTHYESISERP